MYYYSTEAIAQRFSVKKVFLEILQNSQENTSAAVFFYVVAGSLQLYYKRDSSTSVFL